MTSSDGDYNSIMVDGCDGLAGSSTSAGGAASGGGGGVGIRQIGCQTNEEDRTVDTQTEEITRADKSMQFYMGDDTDFLEALKAASNPPTGINR